MKVNIVIVSFIMLFCFRASGQSLNKYKDLITKYLTEEDHYAAYKEILEAMKFETELDSFQYLAGISSFHLNAFSKATKHFKNIIGHPIVERHPEIEFYLAESQYYQGYYGEALIYYKSYLANALNDDKMSQLVSKRMESVIWARENQKSKSSLISVKKLDDQINTRENEFSPFFTDSSLYISSQNYFEKAKRGEVPKNSGRILKYNLNSLKQEDLDTGIFEKNIHMAHPCFNHDGTKLFFTVCNYEPNKTTLICDIYVKIKNAKGWGEKIKMPEPVNKANYSTTQPSIGIDPDTKLEKLFFASNRPGGKGGFDIYSVLLREDNSSTIPENLENINTEENEYSPYFNSAQNILYFSSRGYPGFGGLDIFKYAYKGKEANKVINLGASINSSYDDLYYVENTAKRKAFMVSNKPSSAFLDEEVQACCFDIYKINYIPASIGLIVNTFDKYDSSALNRVKIQVIDITQKDSLAFANATPDSANYKLKITEDKKYLVIGSKDGWVSDTVKCNAVDLENFDDIVKNLFLTEIKYLNALTFERTTNVNLKGATVELWDLDDNRLLKSTTNADSNFFDFKLLKGKNYKLVATKNKYEPATIFISPKETALEPVLQRKLYLELKAIADLRKLLPIRLFFENDMPDPRSESDSTKVGFLDIYTDYYHRKATYIKEFTSKLKGYKKEQSILEIDTFFEESVKKNAEKLKLFMDKLIIILEEGHEIDIFLKGYASPRAKSEYNQKLSSRRVSSVRNEFDRYNNDVFHNYIVNRNFKIKEIPYGEVFSSSDVSDSLEDTRNSIYNLKAAFERRVEILEILKGVEEQ
jgi:outer membrane protein OmpA-like peptidoglycan-associated protein